MQRKGRRYYHVASVDGRRVWTPLGRDYGQAIRAWAELEGDSGTSIRSVADAIGCYLEDARDRLKPATLAGYACSTKKLIEVFGRMPLDAVRRADVYEYVRRRGNVAGNRERALLSATYTWALNSGAFEGVNPCLGLHYRNPEKPRRRYVKDAELAHLIESAPLRWAVLIRFAYLTALREGDLIRLKLTDATEDGILVQTGKTGRPILIGWSDELRALWKQARGARVGPQALFPARGGRAYTSSGFRASWRRVRAHSGIPDLRFHDLRRKAASDLSTEHARALLGHTDAKVTERHYRAKLEPVTPVGVEEAPKRGN